MITRPYQPLYRQVQCLGSAVGEYYPGRINGTYQGGDRLPGSKDDT